MAEQALSGIVITGGSSGIGEALALLYARPGVLLALTGRDAARLQDVADRCRAKGAEVLAETVAATDRTGMQVLIDTVASRARLDLVLANAGVGGSFKTWDQFDDYVRSITDVNIGGVLNTVNPAVPIMVKQGSGQIAIMASLASFLGMPGATPYSSSKHFARAYAEELRGMLAPQGIRVSAICPGFVVSRMTARNKFPMPFLMDTDKAAKIILRGLTENRGRIAFPWPMIAAIRLAGLLPYALLERLMRAAPKKQ